MIKLIKIDFEVKSYYVLLYMCYGSYNNDNVNHFPKF